MADRSLLLSHCATKSLRGFEVGPLLSPFLSRRDSDVIYVDRLATEELRTKFKSEQNVNVTEIVDVDVVVNDGDFVKALSFAKGDGFDFAIASHVIEHIPNIVGWLEQVAQLVKAGGRLLLVIPDKRFTFDYLRDLSTISGLVDAYVRDCRSPTPGHVFDYSARASAVDKTLAWSGELDPATLMRYSNPLEALRLCKAAYREGTYIDSHCWVFTPATFLGLFGELAELGILKWKLAFFADTEIGEEDFGVVLERCTETDDTLEVCSEFRAASARVKDVKTAEEADPPPRKRCQERACENKNRSRNRVRWLTVRCVEPTVKLLGKRTRSRKPV